jgi:RHS repeat-associated protein
MQYDALGRVAVRTDPRGMSEYYLYDRNGNLGEYVNRRGQFTTFSYDALNSLTMRDADGYVTLYDTDPLGAFTATATSFSADTVYFDALGRDTLHVSRRGSLDLRTRNTYDVRDRRTSFRLLQPLDSAIAYAWNNTYDRLNSMGTGVPSKSIVFGYDNAGRMTGLTYPLATPSATSLKYTSYGRVASREPGAGLESLHFINVFDDAGRISEIWSFDQSFFRTISYHPSGRLKEVVGDWMENAHCIWGTDNYFCQADPGDDHFRSMSLAADAFEWDRVGNPVSPGILMDSLGGNRIIWAYGPPLLYDHDGNIMWNGTDLFWNPLSQLDSISYSGFHAGYYYDGWGRRIAKVITDSASTKVMHFVWDGDNIIAEIDSASALLGHFGYLGSTPVFLRRGTDTRYYVHGPAGSIVGMFNENRQVTHMYEYSPFGDIVDNGNTIWGWSFNNPLRFAGQYYDEETGRYYMRARYYDPGMMRFISEDPIGIAGGINVYEYAAGDPVNFSDPSGTCPTAGPFTRWWVYWRIPPCATREDAAIDAMTALIKRRSAGMLKRWEYCGEIIGNDDMGFRYVSPKQGQRYTCGPLNYGLANYAGYYHSHSGYHGYDPERFSDDDMKIAHVTDEPAFLLTQSGLLLGYYSRERSVRVIVGPLTVFPGPKK